MRIIYDTREKPRAITQILAEFERNGIEAIRQKLDFGDYMNPDNPGIVIDRKQNLLEVASNLCQEHDRFCRELKRCNDAGCHMVVLIEHSNRIRSMQDVAGWVNPRLKMSPMAVSGVRLYRIMLAISARYGVDFLFCDKRHTGKRIIEILGGEQ